MLMSRDKSHDNNINYDWGIVEAGRWKMGRVNILV
jgi:hypothetical protein